MLLNRRLNRQFARTSQNNVFTKPLKEVEVVKVTKSVAEKRLADVSQDKQFWCQDGRGLKSLQELESALREMGEDTFRHHSSEARNDFSNWVRDVIGDEKLARDLSKSKTKTQASGNVAGRIAWLKNKMIS